jgi:hypothetical protein
MTNPLYKAKNINVAMIALVVVAVAAVGITAVNSSHAAKKPGGSGGGGGTPTPSTVASSAQLYLSPAKTSAASGANVTFQIHANSGTTSVNAVEADIAYPADKFDFVSIDDSASAFSIKAEASNSDGVVKIARGSTAALTGDQAVATVTFKAKTAKGNASLSFLSTSALVSNSTYKSIVSATAGAIVQFSNK